MKYEYKDIELYKELHKQKNYGDTGSHYTDKVRSFIDATSPTSVLDFGSGTGGLKKSLYEKYNINIDEFDPCYDGKETIPNTQYDLIITTDVMEHLYEDEIENLFNEMLSLQPKFMYHVISTRKATNLLPDGSNCHKTIKDSDWWYSKINKILNPHQITKETTSDTVTLKIIL